jgi:hypothetical protein
MGVIVFTYALFYIRATHYFQMDSGVCNQTPTTNSQIKHSGKKTFQPKRMI